MEIFNDFFKVFNHLTVTQNTSHNFLSLLSWCFHIRGNAKSPQTLNLLLYIVDFSLNKHNYHSISRIFTYFKQDLIFVKGYEFSVKQKYCFYFKQKMFFKHSLVLSQEQFLIAVDIHILLFLCVVLFALAINREV